MGAMGWILGVKSASSILTGIWQMGLNMQTINHTEIDHIESDPFV